MLLVKVSISKLFLNCFPICFGLIYSLADAFMINIFIVKYAINPALVS